MADLYAAEPLTRQDKIGALKRELKWRREVYPRRIARGHMTEDEAARQVAVMEAILADYEGPPLTSAMGELVEAVLAPEAARKAGA
jgi:hypothetical protein